MDTVWREDLSTYTSEELVELQNVNRAWNKELRTRTAELVNSRLAKQIGLEEYATDRNACNEDLEECKRRARVLLDEMTRRASLPTS